MTCSRRLFTQLARITATACKAETKSIVGRRVHQTVTRRSQSSIPSHIRLRSPPRGRVLFGAFAGGSALALLFETQLQPPKTTVREEIQGSPVEEKEVEVPIDVAKDVEVVEDNGTRRFRLAEVKQHDGSHPNPWITRGTSVYDITEWIGAHPGGEVILKAAGGSVEPYWNIFTIHKREDVYEILEQYKIGEIDELDLVDGQVPLEGIDDPFVTDPARDPRLRTLTARPRNAETPGTGLAEFLTPNGLFYVRNHMWVPVVEEPEHKVTVELPDGEEKTYSMKDLKERFKQHKITATLQCAGNRRKDMTDHARQTNGLQWTAGAISSAEWEGVKLRDVLADAGLDLEDLPDDARHAQFSGLEAYGASIPITKAIDPQGDVLLAFKMNGEDLPRDHGYPVRVIVPGNVAARSVKWLRKIVISEEESLTQWQRRDYKSFGPNVGSNPNWAKAKSIQEMPITSAITGITKPSVSAACTEEVPMSVEGYAYSGGGHEIVRVDISTDNGKTWDQAELVDDTMKGSKAWCWKRWRYDGLKRNCGKTTVLVKAVDDAYNTQPESYDHIYNARGNLATAWHRVPFEYKDPEEERKTE